MRRAAEPPTLEVPRRAAAAAGHPHPAPSEWERSTPRALRSWSGEADPLAASHGDSLARLLWDDEALHLQASVAFSSLHLDPRPRGPDKPHGLWEYDVVELFCARGAEVLPYGEIEGSPDGRLLDYFIEEPRRVVDRAWRSGARVRGAVDEPRAGRFTVEIALPWAALSRAAPQPGTPLRANVFVAQGAAGPSRRYLALSPTWTAAPDFHVPACFATLVLRE